MMASWRVAEKLYKGSKGLGGTEINGEGLGSLISVAVDRIDMAEKSMCMA